MENDKSETKLRHYIGRRLEGQKLVHFFSDEESDGWHYPKAKQSRCNGAVIGRQYDLTEGLPLVWSSVEGGDASDDQKLKWQLDDRVAVEMQKQKRRSSSPDLDELVEKLKVHSFSLSRNQQAAFASWLISKIT